MPFKCITNGGLGTKPLVVGQFLIFQKSPQPPEDGSRGIKPPAAGDTGVGEAKAPALENFAFFCKNDLILGLI